MSIAEHVTFAALISLLFASPAGACEGTIELAGGAVGCRSYEGATKTVEFDTGESECKFEKAPRVSITTSTGSHMDSLEVNVLSRSRKGFTVKITTAGRNKNEVCAPTSFSWQAKQS